MPRRDDDARSLRGRAILPTAPALGDGLAWDGSHWAPASGSSMGAVTVVNRNSGPYSASVGELVLCDTTLGGFTIDLPTAVGVSGQKITVRKSSADANAVTVDAAGVETINGDTTLTIVGQYTSIDMVSDNTGWVIV